MVTTCLITTGPNAIMAPVHDRMPVILEAAEYDVWLDSNNPSVEELKTLIHPCRPELLHAHPVTPAINSGRMEGRDCIAPIEVR